MWLHRQLAAVNALTEAQTTLSDTDRDAGKATGGAIATLCLQEERRIAKPFEKNAVIVWVGTGGCAQPAVVWDSGRRTDAQRASARTAQRTWHAC